jgi:hypothetical protein
VKFSKTITLFIILTVGLFFTPGIFAQDFEVTVMLDMQILNNDTRDKLKDFKQQVEDYFNKTKFYDENVFNESRSNKSVNYKIKATLQFTFRSSNGLDYFSGQLFVASQRIVDKFDKSVNPKYSTLFRYYDDRVNFTYTRSMVFVKNDVRFDPLLSLLDYYAYLMLGYDADSFFPVKDIPQKSGTQYFQKAYDICFRATGDKTGWTESGGGSKPTRQQMVQELLNPKFLNFRVGFYEYHWNGIDSLDYTKNAYTYILYALEKIVYVKKIEVKTYNVDVFFDAKAQEIADVFLNYGDKSVYERFIRMDPSHTTIYDNAKKKAK